ncbi:MAG: hypothetical protein F4029_11615 [Gammaproteobacteria bacterium]|nr:hypothetical protein [Gammaproteobacteria bacterium]MYF29279.1 hypothetical protein [Gammaproteobacteria bacterium]MYK46859.1 hypothetical protein [Gammaproteobacteria bacterium]
MKSAPSRPAGRSATARRYDVVLVGGSIAGLAAAMALCQRGMTVACVERDATPMPADHLLAFEQWRRDGAGQIRHSHVLLAPLVNALRRDLRGFFDVLIAAGAEVLTFKDVARNTFDAPEFVPSDDDIAFLSCRRVVFEFLLRRYMLDALDRNAFAFVQGDVRELHTKADGDARRTTGVTVKTGHGSLGIDADIVVDASGRNTRVARWLTAEGIEPPPLEEHPCGIFYTSRFYRLRDGADYPPLDGRASLAGGVAGVDLGYLKAGIFRSDNRTFSITLAADPEDEPLRVVARDREFDLATRAIDVARPWVDTSVSEPISKVYLYGNLVNSRRRYFRNGRPLVGGLFAIGDAGIHTNPIAGRGCALGWLSALELAQTLDAESDAVHRAADFEARIERLVLPWYEHQVRRDAEAMAINKALQRGEDPFEFNRLDGSVDEQIRRRVIFRKGLRYASRESVEVLRMLFRQVNLLDPPGMRDERPDLARLFLEGYQKTADEDDAPRPSRTEFLNAVQTQ